MKDKKYDYLSLFVGIGGLLFFALVVYLLFQMHSRQLSNLEVGLFAISLSMTSVAASILFSVRISERTLEEQSKTYGKLAMRRVVQVIKSCKFLLEILCTKRLTIKDKGFPSKEVTDEFMNNIIGQVSRLISTIYDSKEDWRDILQSESKEAAEIDKEYSDLLLKYQEDREKLELAVKELKKEKINKAGVEQKVESLKSQLTETKEELEDTKRKADSIGTVWPSGASLSSIPVEYSSNTMKATTGWSFLNSNVSNPIDISAGTGLEFGQCVDCNRTTNLKCLLCNRFLCNLCGDKNLSADSSSAYQCKACLTK